MPITSIIPELPSANLQATLDFYTNRLGFALVNQYPDYLLLRRDGQALHFWLNLPEEHGHAHGHEHVGSCYIRVSDLDGLYADFTARGLELKPPLLRDYGIKEIYVLDPDGNLLKFGESI